MKYLFLLFIFLLSFSFFSQNYWQQKVDYVIEVRLDDTHHFLHGNETFTYSNNSPDELKEIYMHLWPNAYKNEKTVLLNNNIKMENDTFLRR